MMGRLHWGSALVLLLVSSFASARNKSPLLDDDTRTRNKAAECVFGKEVRELGSQWIPNLGVPIGVLYCMKCECVAIQRKRRIVARVQCRSVKDECPEPTCEDPIHVPEQCCKTCPGDITDNQVLQDIVPQNVIDEEERSTKHYAALLTGRSSLVLKNDFMKPIQNDINKNNVVATGRFTFHKRNLQYSFYISDKAARPRSLQFVDNEGNILEEFVLSRAGGLVNSVYQNATRKVCGVWRRLPRDYRKLLKQERLYAVLVWGIKDQAEFTISGQMMRYVALGTEIFSTLLEPAPGTYGGSMLGAGGTAIVSISTSVSTSIHVAIIFNGLFGLNEINDVPVNITLSLNEKNYVFQETIHVKKPMNELNLIELSTPVTPADMRLLIRGKLLLGVASVTHPDSRKLTGNVITKATCEIFQATLSSSPSDRNANPNGTSGLAWLFLNNEGSLVYNIQVDNLNDQLPAFITLVDMSTKRRLEIEDLTPQFTKGFANGTLEKLSPKVLEPLYAGTLGVNVATLADRNLIKGRLSPKAVADARDSASPFLMKRENYTLPTSAAGLAWIAVDSDCHIQYDISLSGFANTDRKLELVLELLPMLAPGAPVITRSLDEFQGNQVEGSPVNALQREEVNRLDSGVSFLKVNEKDTKITLLMGTIRHVYIPNTCRLPYTDNNVPNILIQDSDVEPQRANCFFEGKFFEEETQWTTANNPCTMCFCQNGIYNCFTMECPVITCPNNDKPTIVPGDCCPTCPASRNSPQKCIFNGTPYSPGSKFHPFLIPTGFDSCTVCTCDVLTLEIKCSRTSNEKECCKNCHHNEDNNGTFASDDHVPLLINSGRKEAPSKSPQKIMEEGGCPNPFNPKKPYPNGSEYHPSIDSLGEYKCVTCKCQDGNPTCVRQHCDRPTCLKIFRMRKQGKSMNNAEYCCNPKECKKYKHRKNHRPQVITS